MGQWACQPDQRGACGQFKLKLDSRAHNDGNSAFQTVSLAAPFHVVHTCAGSR